MVAILNHKIICMTLQIANYRMFMCSMCANEHAAPLANRSVPRWDLSDRKLKQISSIIGGATRLPLKNKCNESCPCVSVVHGRG